MWPTCRRRHLDAPINQLVVIEIGRRPFSQPAQERHLIEPRVGAERRLGGHRGYHSTGARIEIAARRALDAAYIGDLARAAAVLHAVTASLHRGHSAQAALVAGWAIVRMPDARYTGLGTAA